MFQKEEHCSVLIIPLEKKEHHNNKKHCSSVQNCAAKSRLKISTEQYLQDLTAFQFPNTFEPG